MNYLVSNITGIGTLSVDIYFHPSRGVLGPLDTGFAGFCFQVRHVRHIYIYRFSQDAVYE